LLGSPGPLHCGTNGAGICGTIDINCKLR